MLPFTEPVDVLIVNGYVPSFAFCKVTCVCLVELLYLDVIPSPVTVSPVAKPFKLNVNVSFASVPKTALSVIVLFSNVAA